MNRWAFEAIGTLWRIDTAGDLAGRHRDEIGEAIRRFDHDWSRFRNDSLVSRLGRAGGAVAAPPDAVAMLDAYRALSDATDGAVNPLIGDALESLGYDAGLSLRPGTASRAPQEWTRMLRWTATELTLEAAATIDVGGLGKGRLVDIVLEVLGDVAGLVVVDASGDLRVRGGAQRVALEHPYDATRAIGVVEVADRALCASATNRRVWGDGLHHVLDARTGLPVRRWAATWATAEDAMRADAVTTALFFDGGPQLAEQWGVEWVRMGTDGRVQRSAGWTGELFT